MSDFKLIPIWANAFSSKPADDHEAQRKRLATCLEQMRENVAQLLMMVPSDCRDLTIHDVTHLDAVFEMASTIAGDRFELNPAEAFVLYGAILIHDAGLTSASFAGGLSELKDTTEWKDVAAAHLRQAGIVIDDPSLADPPSHLLPTIVFSVLRALHAKQAEKMASTPWVGSRGEQLYLIPDQELRDAFAATIGRVAHSHHWSIHRVAEELSDNVGAGTVLPIEWAVSERKVACLLRCADACHIDRRRAPSVLYAANKPKGASAVHWDAQNKINKPTLNKTSIVFSSGRSFEYNEAEAWWLVYDLVKVADKEIRASNSLLQDLGHQDFLAQRVYGADNPSVLAKTIRTNGWKPVDAEVRVSDPLALAKSLGGSRLYGEYSIAPIRELLQNSADAIRARRSLEQRQQYWGDISLTIEPDLSNPSGCVLHVDDNGIGMSERVMAGPLIDFGKSIWNSGILREEYPGLESSFLNPVGKFGIGFFSIFDVSDRVVVISKRYDDGRKDAKVLEFNGLSTRPIMRPANANELPIDASTRITLYIADRSEFLLLGVGDRVVSDYSHSQFNIERRHDVRGRILSLIASLDVRVKYKDSISNDDFEHKPDLFEVDPNLFIDELYGSLPSSLVELLKRMYSHRLRPMVDAAGQILGIGAIRVQGDNHYFQRTEGHRPGYEFLPRLSVGGFTIGVEDFPIIGVLFGNTNNVSRKDGFSNLDTKVLKDWATEQAKLVIGQSSTYRIGELVAISQQVVGYGGNPFDLPFCLGCDGIQTFNWFRSQILNLDKIYIPCDINSDYKDEGHLTMSSYEELHINYTGMKLKHNVFLALCSVSVEIDDDTYELINEKRSASLTRDQLASHEALNVFISIIEAEWGGSPILSVEEVDIFEGSFIIPEHPSCVLSISKPG